MNDVVYREAAGEPPAERTPLNTVRYLAKAYAACGYDYVNAQGCTLSFNPKIQERKTRSPSMAAFALPIGESFERFQWPDPASFDFSVLKEAAPFCRGI